jgi:glucosamine--fructose-6-phosphate aminotransferase (isomerizing)
VIGYVGRREAKERLLRGLDRLEYRRYDSAGICLIGYDGLASVKPVGKLENPHALRLRSTCGVCVGSRPER